MLESRSFCKHVSGWGCVFQPFTPSHQNAYSPYCSLYISKDNKGENLFNNQELLLLLVIISFNLRPLMFEFCHPTWLLSFNLQPLLWFFNCLLSSLILTLTLNFTLSNYFYKEEEKEEEASKHQNNRMGRSK